MLEDDKPRISIAAGIVIGIVASLVQSLGLTIQRKSHVRNDELPEEQRVAEHKRPLWLLGFAIFITSNILGSVFQIASLPVVILAPLGAVSLLWNAAFARLILGDELSHFMLMGTFLICGGGVLIAFFGIVPEPTHSLDDLLRLFRRDTFVLYFSLLAAATFIILGISHFIESRLPAIALPDSPILGPIPEEENENTPPTERTPLLLIDGKPPAPDTPPPYAETRLWLAISYASASGLLSGMCLIFAKSGVELLLLTLGGDNQFGRWESWILVTGLAVMALLQLWYLHKSLILADPTLVCPLAFCFYNISSIFNGLVYFDQFSALTPTSLAMVLVGMVVLLAGVWIVSVQSENGRVEVGTWQEGTEVLTSEATGVQSLVAAPAVRPSSPVLDRSWHASIRRSQAYSDEPMSAISEDFPLLDGAGSPEMTASVPTSPRASQGFSPNHPLVTSPPRRPLLQRALGSKKKWPSILLDNSGTSRGSLSLSIGLSPASPGFVLKTSSRSRRVSGENQDGQTSPMERRRFWRTRRTVSESDADTQSVDAAAEAGRSRIVAPEESYAQVQSPDQGQAAASSHPQGPLGWLRSYFGSK